ncbi:MAG: hypothetical protein L0G51_01075 [Lactococcus lactis]|nr:hypothetical protein [Lactococcus lactis]
MKNTQLLNVVLGIVMFIVAIIELFARNKFIALCLIVVGVANFTIAYNSKQKLPLSVNKCGKVWKYD